MFFRNSTRLESLMCHWLLWYACYSHSADCTPESNGIGKYSTRKPS